MKNNRKILPEILKVLIGLVVIALMFIAVYQITSWSEKIDTELQEQCSKELLK